MENILYIISNCQKKGITFVVDDANGTLKIKGNLKELSDKEMEEIKLAKDAIIDFLKSMRRSDRSIEVLDKQTDYALSLAQRRLWILSQFTNSNIAYNMTGIYVFTGDVNIKAMEMAFRSLIERHEILRTIFRENEIGEVRQWIRPASDMEFVINRTDLRSRVDRESHVKERVQADGLRPFDLSADILLRANIYQLEDDKWIFSFTMHHIISDGWSMGILIREVMFYYNAFISDSPDSLLPSLRIQYKDYAVWQEQETKNSLKEHQQYWLRQFAGELPILELPTDFVRPLVKTYKGKSLKKMLDVQHSAAIKNIAQSEGATLFMGLVALVNVLLYRYTGQEDIIIGSPIAGREHFELEDQIGFYVNTLALRTRFKGSDSFQELITAIKDSTLSAYKYQNYPFEKLVDALDMKRDMSRNPLFDVWVVLHNTHVNIGKEQYHHNKFKVSEYDGELDGICRYDLSFSFLETDEGILAEVAYNTDIFTAERITRLLTHLEQLLCAIVEDPGKSIGLLQILSKQERHELLNTFNPEPVCISSGKTIVQLFEEQVLKTPFEPAVIFEDIELTYEEVNAKANQLARYLFDKFQIKAGDLVGIKLERSEKMIVAILGVLKSGGAYVPIDSEYPQERVEYLLTESNCKVLVDENFLAEIFHELSSRSKENIDITIRDSDLAYVIYTSGSTGQPKGVMIEHQALVDYHYGILAATNISECKRFGHFSTIAADLGNTIIYTSLLIGGAIIMFPMTGITSAGKNTIHNLDCIKIVPSHWKALQTQSLKAVPAKALIFGGERLTAEVLNLLEPYQDSVKIYNHYGPTETTIGKLIDSVNLPPVEGAIALGRPFGENYVYILNGYQQLVPKGLVGEICISGKGIARGYLNRPGLTTEKFIEDPFHTGKRMYRTGDLGRWLSDGRIEFVGRRDMQVKIRGYRVELGEIESALRKQPGIDAAVVVPKQSKENETQLIAYITGTGVTDIAEVRLELSKLLPSYMLPGDFIQMEDFPLTKILFT